MHAAVFRRESPHNEKSAVDFQMIQQENCQPISPYVTQIRESGHKCGKIFNMRATQPSCEVKRSKEATQRL